MSESRIEYLDRIREHVFKTAISQCPQCGHRMTSHGFIPAFESAFFHYVVGPDNTFEKCYCDFIHDPQEM